MRDESKESKESMRMTIRRESNRWRVSIGLWMQITGNNATNERRREMLKEKCMIIDLRHRCHSNAATDIPTSTLCIFATKNAFVFFDSRFFSFVSRLLVSLNNRTRATQNCVAHSTRLYPIHVVATHSFRISRGNYIVYKYRAHTQIFAHTRLHHFLLAYETMSAMRRKNRVGNRHWKWNHRSVKRKYHYFIIDSNRLVFYSWIILIRTHVRHVNCQCFFWYEKKTNSPITSISCYY